MKKGRKSKYNPEIVEKICNMIESDTFTIEEICKSVGITTETYFVWLREKNDFSDSIKKAESNRPQKLLAYARNSHRKMLEGYDYDEVKTIIKNVKVGKDANGLDIYKPIKLEETITKKHIPPNPTLIIFTQKSLDADRYGEKTSVDITTGGDKLGMNITVVDEDTKRDLEKLINDANNESI